MTGNCLTPPSRPIDGIDSPYNPIVPVSIGHSQFSGPLDLLCKVNELPELIQYIEYHYYENEAKDCGRELQEGLVALSFLFSDLRERLQHLCPPVQLQYIDTLIYNISQGSDWHCPATTSEE